MGCPHLVQQANLATGVWVPTCERTCGEIGAARPPGARVSPRGTVHTVCVILYPDRSQFLEDRSAFPDLLKRLLEEVAGGDADEVAGVDVSLRVYGKTRDPCPAHALGARRLSLQLVQDA